MASATNISYHRLRNEDYKEELLEREVKKARAWLKFKALAGRRRPKIKIPRLRRVFRKRSRLLTRFRVSWLKALKKLKNGQSHMNDLFGGNYLIMQANPAPFRCPQKAYLGHGLSSRCPILHESYSLNAWFAIKYCNLFFNLLRCVLFLFSFKLQDSLRCIRCIMGP